MLFQLFRAHEKVAISENNGLDNPLKLASYLTFRFVFPRFVLYKLPPTTTGKATDGRAYVYRTSVSTQGDDGSTWIFSQQSIDSAASLPGQTLEPIYNFPVTFFSFE